MPAKEYLYRHMTCSRFQLTGVVGEKPFDFKNNLLRITEEDRNDRFLDLAAELHPRDRAQIKEINAQAAANLERALGPRVSREAMDTGLIRSSVKSPDGGQQMTQAQIDQLAEEQRANDAAAQSREAAAIAEAEAIIAAGATNAEDERLARVAAEEEKAAQAGQIDQTENQPETAEAAPAPAPAPSGIQSIVRKK